MYAPAAKPRAALRCASTKNKYSSRCSAQRSSHGASGVRGAKGALPCDGVLRPLWSRAEEGLSAHIRHFFTAQMTDFWPREAFPRTHQSCIDARVAVSCGRVHCQKRPKERKVVRLERHKACLQGVLWKRLCGDGLSSTEILADACVHALCGEPRRREEPRLLRAETRVYLVRHPFWALQLSSATHYGADPTREQWQPP